MIERFLSPSDEKALDGEAVEYINLYIMTTYLEHGLLIDPHVAMDGYRRYWKGRLPEG